MNRRDGTFDAPVALEGEPRGFETDQFGLSSFEEARPPVISLEVGRFDDDSTEDIAFPTADGLEVVSLSRGTVARLPTAEPILDFATADLNTDGLADIAILHERSVVLWLSNS